MDTNKLLDRIEKLEQELKEKDLIIEELRKRYRELYCELRGITLVKPTKLPQADIADIADSTPKQ